MIGAAFDSWPLRALVEKSTHAGARNHVVDCLFGKWLLWEDEHEDATWHRDVGDCMHGGGAGGRLCEFGLEL
jgi:hypothetical protein